MKLRDVGLISMTCGVLCGIIFVLLNMSRSVNTQLSNLIMLIGIIALAVGLVLFVTTSSGSEKKGNKK